jgi:hypothetical protein
VTILENGKDASDDAEADENGDDIVVVGSNSRTGRLPEVE